MNGYVLFSMVFCAALLGSRGALAQDELVLAERPFHCHPLGFAIGVPQSWQTHQDHTGLVVHDSSQTGYTISREPFLGDEDTYAETWRRTLASSGLDTTVDERRVGRYTAFHAMWKAPKGNRHIYVWRVYVKANEMLYNVSFSVTPAAPLIDVMEVIVKSFKYTGKQGPLVFQNPPESLGARVSMRMPEGFARLAAGVRLGGGDNSGFLKLLPGYKEPHVAGSIRVRGFDARVTYQERDGSSTRGGDTKGLAETAWQDDRGRIKEVLKKPRVKSARYGGLKGHAMEAKILSKAGLPQRWFVFVGKSKNTVLQINIIVDEREIRLYKNYLKSVCNELKLRE